MLEDFKSFVTSEELFDPSDKILIAISGGIDSVVLADLFYKLKLNFAIAHCNFCLRGEESDADEDFVKKISKKYKVELYSEKFDTNLFAEQEKVGIQVAARMLRYTWFNKLCDQYGFQYIATAHHKNDVLETVLLNLVRGTGISGLHGIKAKNGRLIRPMLFADKEQIRDYVAEKQLIWREDSSNESNKYSRNLIRNEVIPLLKNINSNLEETIFQTVEKVSIAEEVFFSEIVNIKKAILINKEGSIIIQFDLFVPKPVLYLFELIKDFNFNYDQAGEIHQSLDQQSGKQFISPTHLLVKDRDTLVVTPKDISEFTSIEIKDDDLIVDATSFKLKLKALDIASFKLNTSAKMASLDYDKLKFPLKIRKWKEGDWFIPLGMNGKKKISDLLIDQKISLNLKEKVRVITSGDSIIWVTGIRIDDRFKVTPKTMKVYTMVIS